MDCMNIENCKKWLKENLDEERYEHSCGVAEYAEFLAEKYGEDTKQAYFCGLIHDCAKCISAQELKNMICECSDLCDGELTNTKTYHAPAGAILAKNIFNISDEKILSAIRWHTLGKTNMSDFEKIIFIADKAETRTRTFEEANAIREALKEEDGLNKALLICYKNTIKSLVDRNLKICNQTIEIYNELLSK